MEKKNHYIYGANTWCNGRRAGLQMIKIMILFWLCYLDTGNKHKSFFGTEKHCLSPCKQGLLWVKVRSCWPGVTACSNCRSVAYASRLASEGVGAWGLCYLRKRQPWKMMTCSKKVSSTTVCSSVGSHLTVLLLFSLYHSLIASVFTHSLFCFPLFIFPLVRTKSKGAIWRSLWQQ